MLDWIAMENNGDWSFADYFMHVSFVADPSHLYERVTGSAGCFPPLAYIMYYALYRLSSRGDATPADWTEALSQEYALVVFLYYTLAVSALFLLAVWLWLQDGKRAVAVFTCLMLSVPFLAGGIERGNSTILVMALLLIALRLKDYPSRVGRESALIIIAICAALKIYPAIFCLLYVKDHRWGEVVKLVAYSVALFLLPFAFFGGREAFVLWLSNITSTMGRSDVGRIQYIKGLVITVSYLAVDADVFPSVVLVATICQYSFLLAMIYLAIRSEDDTRTLIFLCSAMVLFPVNAHRYTLCYLAIPLIAHLTVDVSHPSSVAILFGVLFSCPVLWGAVTSFRFNLGYHTLTYVEFWEYTCAYVLLLGQVLAEVCGFIAANHMLVGTRFWHNASDKGSWNEIFSQ